MINNKSQKSELIKVSDLSFAVVGVARNCGKTISKDIHRIKDAVESAKAVLWLVVESDSSDDTVQQLENLQTEIPNFHFVSLGQLSNSIPKRTDRISFCRNHYVEQIRNNPIFSKLDYVVVADLDGINSMLSKEAFETSWLRCDWDMCAANQAGPYYDIWALRHKDWSPNDCWAQNRFFNAYQRDPKKSLWASVYSKMITIPENEAWIEVDSAFGGFAIYKKQMFDECEYVGITDTGEEFCEHVHFHRILKAKGAKLFINPQLINAGLTEHTVNFEMVQRGYNNYQNSEESVRPIENIIPPEVSNDSFFTHLQLMAQRPDLKTFLEIGSSSGAGSTQALVSGLLERKAPDAQLFCMELSRTRFINLVKTYQQYEFVLPYNLSSVSLSDFPSKDAVVRFYESTKTNLNKYDLHVVLSWLQQDIDYINAKRLNFCGIDFIKSCNQIKKFDFVLIDGSEFTGEAELQHVWGAKVIALDDVNAYKCFAAYLRLSNHYAYKLIAQDLTLRNGYAFFELAY